MQISDAEKLILYMLCDVHEALNIKDSVDPDFIRSALSEGQSWAIKQKYNGIFDGEEVALDLKTEVYEILHLWSLIQASYSQLSPAESDDLKAKLGRNYPPFYGFDGNNEIEHLSIAFFIVNRMAQFASIKHLVKNSHMPVLRGYRQMLAKWDVNQWDEERGMIPVPHLLELLTK